MTDKSKKSEILNVAVDDGYAQTKLVGENPETGEIVKEVIRSSVRQGRSGLSSFNGGGIDQYETEEGDFFTVSNEIESENTQFDGFHTSQLNRVLVNHALIKCGYGGRKVNLVTGLPVADYFVDDERDIEHIDAKTSNLKLGVMGPDSRAMPKIENVRVGCQAVAAWFDYVLDDNLEQRNDASGGIAIVDIGGRTTDVAVVVGGNAIDHSRSGTENIGVLDVYTELRKAIRREFKIKEKFPLDQLDAAVRTGEIRLWNKQHSVAELVETVVGEHERKIAREVERQLGSAANLNAVVFVGGGSALFSTIAGHFPNGHMPDDPEFANAKGLYKFIRVKG